VIAVLLVVVDLTMTNSSPSSDVKPEAATAVVAPDDGHENAQNMLSCI
jgi:hypothetical protein